MHFVLFLYVLINKLPSFGMNFWCSCHVTEQAKLSVLKTTNRVKWFNTLHWEDHINTYD